MPPSVEILMITHKRPDYTRRSLSRLLDTCDGDARVWVWQNGSDVETLEVVRSFRGHPRLAKLHESEENIGIRDPTNWFWKESEAPLLGKVDDDCLMPPGWIEKLASAHATNPTFGSIACWHFREEDFAPELAAPKIREFAEGQQLLVNFWTQGTGYLLKRDCVEANGYIGREQSFTGYCVQLALAGWTNGWYLPLLPHDHMDDPRSDFTMLRNDGDLRRFAPLSAQTNRVDTLKEWGEQLQRSARLVQTASIDPRDYRGARRWLRRMKQRGRRLLTGHSW